MLEWLILYADGSTFGNKDGEPYEAPRNGVQAVLMEDKDSGVRHEGSPVGYWAFREGEWNGFEDHMGFWDHVFHSGEPLVLVFGRTLKSKEWERTIKQKSKEQLGIKKFGWRERERSHTT